MKIYCLKSEPAGHSLYEGNPGWSSHSVGYLRRAFEYERRLGYGAWIVFDRLERPFSGDSPEAAIEAFDCRPMTCGTAT